ncbi:peptide deformylase [Staphylococcus aureus]|uniref:peptide deformylase n=1 Tax=Staphylococcus aureus TaxID=1280 RepID=UPI002647D717|nr:peptide deformylase [Staphylococcus aureus]
MAVLKVLHIPDERLRKVAEPVKEVNAEIQRIVDDMFDTAKCTLQFSILPLKSGRK